MLRCFCSCLFGLFVTAVFLAAFKHVCASECDVTFDAYAGFSGNSFSITTLARNAMECSTRCASMKCESESCQIATFRRDTSECLLSNGTVANVDDVSNGNYKTIVVKHSEARTSYRGREFYTGFMANYDDSTSLQLLFVAAVPTTVKVDIPVLSITESFVLDDAQTRNYSYNLAHTVNGEHGQKGVYIATSQPITLYQSNNRNFSIDTSLVLPTAGTGKTYIVQPTPNTIRNNTFLVVSTSDANTVTISKGSNITTLTLGRLETYFGSAIDLTDTVITASEDIIVQSGGACIEFPEHTSSCDHMYEIVPPVESYGKLFVVGSMFPRPDYTLGILAQMNQTSVTISDVNGLTIETFVMNRAESRFREFTGDKTIAVVSSEGISVTQYGHSYSSSYAFGDPSMMVIAPLTKLGTVYDVLLPSADMNVIEVVTDDESLIRLNGNPATFIRNLSVSVPSITTMRIAYAHGVAGRYRITHLNSMPFAVYVYGGGVKYEYSMCAGWLK